MVANVYASDFKDEPNFVKKGDGLTVRYCSRRSNTRRPEKIAFFYQPVRWSGMVKGDEISTGYTDADRIGGLTITFRACWYLRFVAPDQPGKYRIVARMKVNKEGSTGEKVATSDTIEVLDFGSKSPDARFVTKPNSEKKPSDSTDD